MLRILLSGVALSLLAAKGQPSGPYVELFNGKDLQGWKVVGGKEAVWGADKGILFVDGRGGGWLMTEKDFDNFELRLEYKMPEHGNSGVALRSPMQGDPAYSGMEIQLIDDLNWKGLRPYQHTGSIYDVVPAAKVVSKKPGEWQSIRIVADGPKVRVEVNGELLVDANLEDHKDRLKDDPEKKLRAHPGLARKSGHIGLQSHDGRVEFRNIQLRPITAPK